MSGMDDGPGTDLGSLGSFTAIWAVMMAAMMLPVSVPTILGHARVQALRRGPLRSTVPAALFVVGYLTAWIVVGVAAYLAFQVVKGLDLGALSWDRSGRYIAGGAIVVSALYQLTGQKDCCLETCRGHFDPPAERSGGVAAAREGVSYGVWCVGCCWALFVALFALGVMSLQWMVVIAVLIAAERLLPLRRVARQGIAVLLLVLGIGVAAAPGQVPGLTQPGQMSMHGGAGMHMNGGAGMHVHRGAPSMHMKSGMPTKPGGQMRQGMPMKPGAHMRHGMPMKPGSQIKQGIHKHGMQMKPGGQMK